MVSFRGVRSTSPESIGDGGGMDSGFSLREPRNDGGSYATISCNTFISASGAVIFGAWLASSSK